MATEPFFDNFPKNLEKHHPKEKIQKERSGMHECSYYNLIYNGKKICHKIPIKLATTNASRMTEQTETHQLDWSYNYEDYLIENISDIMLG